MACEPLPFINSDIDLGLNIPVTDIPTVNISDITVIFTLISDASITKEYKKSLGQIEFISDGEYSITITNQDITIEGWYKVDLIVTDTSSKIRSFTPCYHNDSPYIKFYGN